VAKTALSLTALGLVGVLSLAVATPAIAKKRIKSNSAQRNSAVMHQTRKPFAAAPAPPIVKCLHGVWDPYGLRCDQDER